MYNSQLDTFIKVADLGSFNKAAEAMFISSSAIIQQINLLENRCGFKLFNRTNHGISLTSAGKSLYDDAKTIIKFSQDALEKGKRIAEASQTTVRVGTSLLFRCRLLPNIWAKISEKCPDLKIEILPMAERNGRNTSFSLLGKKYDMWEGIYGSAGWLGLCNFLELKRTSICCGIAKNHPLANKDRITISDLKGQCIIMPIQGVSKEIDLFRDELKQQYPSIEIIDSDYYGIDTFTMCELNGYVLITQLIYEDIHTNLVTIPIDTKYTLPYGIIYANNPTTATSKFINAVIKMQKDNII